jgi:hypothetical protein
MQFQRAMAQQRGWVFDPKAVRRNQKLPDTIKAKVLAEAQTLIDDVPKPQHVKPPGKNERFNYLVDIFSKWHGRFFYFCATYNAPGPNALSPSFETRFARLEYIGNNSFAPAYMRHTGEWWEVFPELTMEQALKSISEGGMFTP